MKRAPALLATALLAAALVLAVGAPPAHAAITVTETADENNVDGDCSLREAVQSVNTGAAVDACPAPTDAVIVLPAGTYDMGAGIAPTFDLELVGAGADATVLDCSGAAVCINNVGVGTTLDVSAVRMVDGAGHFINQVLGADRLTVTDAVFDTSETTALRSASQIVLVRSEVIDSGDTAVATTDGAALVDSSIRGAEQMGVASDEGPVELLRSNVSGNGFWGVSNDDGSVIAVESTIRSNASHGIHTDEGDVLALNATIARNGGHGIETATGNLSIESSTLAENDFQGFSWIGPGGSAYVVNSILANDAAECDNPAMVSGGFNLTNDALGGCNFDQPTDQIDVDPELDALDSHGGPTLTYLPLAESPAIDRGGDCPDTDQRGELRPADGDDDGDATCDVGSVEVQPDDPNTGGSGSGSDGGSVAGATAATPVPLQPRFTG